MARHSRHSPSEDETAQIPIDVDVVAELESGPLSLKGGNYEPMYRGGANPHHNPPDKSWTATEREVKPQAQSNGMVTLIFVGVGCAIGAIGLALWVYVRGCNCPVQHPKPLTPTITETITTPAVPT